jgi:LysR family transcriptional regulator, low CO2-responsive transcriptional regulator
MDMLESDALHAFAAFARHRNFTAAAAELRISQPSLHVKITKLARRLGLELYRREGRGLVLTEHGRILAAFAEESHRRVGDVLAELGHEQPVRLAAGRGTLRWVISAAVQAMARHTAGLRVIAANRTDALASLDAGQADVAVIAFDPPPPTMRHKQIAAYPQVLVVDKDHRLARRKRLHLSDVDGMELLVPAAGRPHRLALDRALRDAGVAWRVAAEVDGWDLLVHFAGLGLGATVVNGCVRLPPSLRGIPIADLPEVRYWAAWRAKREGALGRALAELGAS